MDVEMFEVNALRHRLTEHNVKVDTHMYVFIEKFGFLQIGTVTDSAVGINGVTEIEIRDRSGTTIESGNQIGIKSDTVQYKNEGTDSKSTRAKSRAEMLHDLATTAPDGSEMRQRPGDEPAKAAPNGDRCLTWLGASRRKATFAVCLCCSGIRR
ncbi:hypothetical protein EVAR_60805_1 [Eumeta japonica]|uniref:Uncharacterized protein n=1 Tax=Eumeta variegata TaxID=151549 RepID=A0A4C1YJ95_EUMVA|nr:hypothetical protein EVAR_60805_1 [Eumeta japonica]